MMDKIVGLLIKEVKENKFNIPTYRIIGGREVHLSLYKPNGFQMFLIQYEVNDTDGNCYTMELEYNILLNTVKEL